MADKEQILRKLLTDIVEERNLKDATINIKAISSGGANYTSLLYTASISAPNEKTLELFAKVGNLGEQIRQVVPTYIFDVERYVYQDLANIFKRIEEKAEVPEQHRYVFPKVYGYNSNLYEETIVLEDLTAQGYGVYDRMTSIDWPYASKAVEALAKFHALAMAYEQESPEEYHVLVDKLTKQVEPAMKVMTENFDDYIKVASSVLKEENKGRLRKYFTNLLAKGEVFEFAKPKRKAVLIHCDYRPSNIMHRTNEDGSIDLIPVDYQTIMGGCGAADLLYFIFGGSDEQFRAKYYQRLVDHYYENLSDALKRLRLNPEKIYPREDFDYDLRKTLPYGLITGVMVLPVVTVDSHNAPDLNNGFGELAAINTSSLYPARINGVIDDYISMGIL